MRVLGRRLGEGKVQEAGDAASKIPLEDTLQEEDSQRAEVLQTSDHSLDPLVLSAEQTDCSGMPGEVTPREQSSCKRGWL